MCCHLSAWAPENGLWSQCEFDDSMNELLHEQIQLGNYFDLDQWATTQNTLATTYNTIATAENTLVTI